jgi:hypothetical protein
MHTDPQSLVDVWPRRNMVLNITPKWLISLALPVDATNRAFMGRRGAKQKTAKVTHVKIEICLACALFNGET